MKTLIRLLIIFLVIHIGKSQTFAQYSFTPTLHGAGTSECSQAAAQANSMLRGFQVSGIPTKRECESIRAQILAIKASGYGCNVYYTCTPCVGTDMGPNNISIDLNSSGEPQLNPGVDVCNGIDDYKYRREVQQMQSSFDLIVTKGNVEYDQTLNSIIQQNIKQQQEPGVSLSLKQMIPNVENAIQSTALDLIDKMNVGGISDAALSEALKNAFESLTSINVELYSNKPELTYEDQEILNRYNEFCDQVLASMLHEYANGKDYQYTPYEMATYALHVYDDDPARGFDESCVPLTDVAQITNVEERASVQKILDFLGENNNKADFQAELYYDKDQDKYILAFRGTEVKLSTLLKDWQVDGTYLLTGQSPQHDIAAALGELILESGIPTDKLTITGHSLGGGLALVTGMKSGVETYTYNPLHLNTEAIKHYNLNIDNQENVHNFSEFAEHLVGMGEVSLTMIAKNIYDIANPTKHIENILEGNGLFHPVDVGESTSIICPHTSVDPTNHKMGNLIQGVAEHGGDKTSSYIHGRNMRQAIKRMRAEKPYRQAATAIRINTGGLEFQVVKRN